MKYEIWNFGHGNWNRGGAQYSDRGTAASVAVTNPGRMVFMSGAHGVCHRSRVLPAGLSVAEALQRMAV